MGHKIYDAVALGEYLIDFVPEGVSVSGEPLLERNPGGAPVNVLAALAKLGNKTAFIGKVGQDPFGEYLRDVLIRQGIADEGLVLSRDAHTTMAFVHLDERGERSFHFARQPGADALLTEAEVRPELTRGTRLFHFGSISLTSEPSRHATIHAVEAARQAGAIISYDPNWRPSLWETEELGLVWMKSGLEQAHIVKVSDEELALLTGLPDAAHWILLPEPKSLSFATGWTYCLSREEQQGRIIGRRAMRRSGSQPCRSSRYDRGGRRFHGRVSALCARQRDEGGELERGGTAQNSRLRQRRRGARYDS